MPPIRVLVVTVVHNPEDARIRHRQIRAMCDAGWAVTLAAPFEGYGLGLPADLPAINLPRASGRHRTAALRAARTLLGRIHRDFDLILLHDPELLLAVPWGARHRTIWDVHEDTGAALSLKNWLPKRFRGMSAILVRRTEAWAEKNLKLLLSEEAYSERFKNSHPVVPNSVWIPAVEPPEPGPARLVYIGALTKARGAIEMVEVARRLPPSIELHLVGNAAPDVKHLIRESHKKGRLVWHGFLPNTKALELLPGALAGLSLLHDELNYAHSQPTKVMEYMSYGIPVITTPNPKSVDLVQRHKCGIVVPFQDVDRVVAEVARLGEDAALR